MGPYSGSGTRVELGKRVGRSLVYFKNQLALPLYTSGFTNTHSYYLLRCFDSFFFGACL